jgi:tyrosinase
MSRLSINVWRVSLCLMLCMTTAVVAQEQLSGQHNNAPAEVLDPAFDQYFDLALLAPAVERGDAEVLADMAIQAAVGEEILHRSHKTATAKEIAQVAKDVAFASGNELAFERLLLFARKTGDKQLVDEIQTRRKLSGGSRTASEMLNLDDIAVEDLQSYQDYSSDIQLARRLGIRSKLEQIRDDAKLRELPTKIRDRVIAALGQAIAELEDSASPLAKLLGASRECKNQSSTTPIKPVSDSPRWKTVQQLIEIEINGPSPYDDYLTWAPTPGRIRLSRDVRSKGPVNVCLTNDTGTVGGDVLFAPFQFEWPRYTTATESILTLTLPAYTGDDEGWVHFVVAGAFGRSSQRDKDTIIEAHLESPSGRVLGSHAMMVRVRKAAHRMTAEERDRYLAVLERMRPQDGSADMIQYFEGVHREAGPRSHKGPAFLPWHRAFLLHFERQLQTIDPSVSLPYWDWSSDVSHLLTGDFLGISTREVVEFDGLNPIRNWTSGNQRIHRSPGVQGIYMGALDPRVANAFRQSSYGPYPQGFGVELEQRLHDEGHGWVGGNRGWMADAEKAAQDPLFYMHHCNVDRTWAQWQYVHDRFGDSTPVDYWPAGDYTPGSGYPGNNLEATMWPWNESVSAAFPASGRMGIWPRDPTAPRPRDMIDYLGVRLPAVDLGFCYDDVQFGTAAGGASPMPPSPLVSRDVNRTIYVSTPAPQLSDEANDRAIQDFFDVRLPPDQRQQAGEAIQYLSRDYFGNIGILLCNEQEPEALRIIAIKKVPAAAILDSLLHVLETAPADQRTELAVATAKAVRVATVSESGHEQRQQISRILRRFINTPCSEVRDVSLAVLVGSHDPEAVRFIKDSLSGKVEGCNLLPADAISLLAFDDPVQHLNVIRPFLNSPDANVCVEAILAVEFDPATRQTISQLLQDRGRPLEVRRAALKASERDMPTCLATVNGLIMDANEAPELRLEAVNALAGIVSGRVRTINQHAQRVKLGYRESLADTIPALSDKGRVEIAGLLNQIAKQPGPDAVRAAAAKVLGWLRQNDPALQGPAPRQADRASIVPAIIPREQEPAPRLPIESIVQTYGISTQRGNVDVSR